MNISIFFSFFVFGLLGLVFIFVSYGVVVVSFVDWYFMNLKLSFFFGSYLFSLVLFVVSLSVILFSSYYMEGELNLVYFLVVFFVFVVSMFILILGYSLFFLVVGWDILGVSSFFLVLFYNNWDSCSGAMNTVLTNRIGDFFLFFFFVYFFFSSLSLLVVVYLFLVVGLLLVVTGFTKSAQFPFSGWLPKAMSAPTPVSALVHSSTLVTAGLVLILGFLGVVSGWLMKIMFLFGLLTMFFSSVGALVEQDVKKIVALSTLSQMGFSMMVMGMGFFFVCLLHLVGHALFKSCLFMQVGIYIHSNLGQQDGRGYCFGGGNYFFVHLQMLVTLFCLCGLFFTSGFVTKDMILSFFFVGDWVWLLSVLLFVGVFFTFLYSYRLFMVLFGEGGMCVQVLGESFLMGVFSFFLLLFSIVFNWWLVNNVVLLPVFYLYFDVFVPLLYLLFVGVFFFLVWLGLFVVEFKWSFGVDFFAKQGGLGLVFFKFIEGFLNCFMVLFVGFMNFLSLVTGMFFTGLELGLLVVVFFVLVFLL